MIRYSMRMTEQVDAANKNRTANPIALAILIILKTYNANDQDQPVAATDIPMCVQPIGNSAASFC